MPTAEIEALFAHMEWADATVWEAVGALGDAAEDRRLRRLLVHLHTVQRVYLDLWRGDPFDPPDPDGFSSLAEVRAWASEYYEELRSLLREMEEADGTDLGRTVDFPWAEQLVAHFGEVHPATLGETMLQIPAHTAHHRGQVTTRLRELGGEPPLVDFIAWVWMGRPAAPRAGSGATG